MARTTAGAQLTEQHNAQQLTVRAAALRQYAALWPIWTGDGPTFRALVDATLPIVREQHRASAQLAASYFAAFRFAERPGGTASPVLPDPPETSRIAGTLYVVGRDITRRAVAAGQGVESARRNALVRTSGAVTTLVLDGGRQTLLESVNADPMAPGWARTASAGCCAFCAMLASRGAIYGEDSGQFEAHDHCGCSLEPTYPGSHPTANAHRYRELWEHAKPAGRDALKAFASLLEDDRREAQPT